MKAILISRFGGPEVLIHKQVPKPTPSSGEVLIQVKAFGLNHAETHMRKGEWDEYDPISGLECVGLVADCPDHSIPLNSIVAAVMGGMGRTRPGSYGEYVTVPTSNVLVLEAQLKWEELAALPEVYCTAWSCLFTILGLRKGETILVRGATSTIGQAAVKLANNAGAHVTATTRREKGFEALRNMGASDVKLESLELHKSFREGDRFDKCLNLIGNVALLDSIILTKPGGRMLQAGWLGGLNPVRDFNPMLQMSSGVHFSLFHSKVLGTPDFPLQKVPLQEIVDMIERGEFEAKPVKVFEYGEIQEAHRLLDSGEAGGKVVVKH